MTLAEDPAILLLASQGGTAGIFKTVGPSAQRIEDAVKSLEWVQQTFFRTFLHCIVKGTSFQDPRCDLQSSQRPSRAGKAGFAAQIRLSSYFTSTRSPGLNRPKWLRKLQPTCCMSMDELVCAEACSHLHFILNDYDFMSVKLRIFKQIEVARSSMVAPDSLSYMSTPCKSSTSIGPNPEKFGWLLHVSRLTLGMVKERCCFIFSISSTLSGGDTGLETPTLHFIRPSKHSHLALAVFSSARDCHTQQLARPEGSFWNM